MSGGDEPRPRAVHGRGRERRRRLVAAAAQLYRDEGRGAVTQRAVARRADSSLSAMTYYFEDLNDLLLQAARYSLRSRIRDLVKIAADPGRLGEDLASAIVAAVLSNGGLGHERQWVENQCNAADEAIAVEELEHLYCHMDRALEALWEHHGMTAPLLTRQIIALLHGAVVLTPPERDVADYARETLTELLETTGALQPG